MSTADSFPDDIATLKAMLVAERAARMEAEVIARSAEAKAHARALGIAKLKFLIAKLRHQRLGQSAERSALLEQLELQRADLEETAAEADTAAKIGAPANAEKVQAHGFERMNPARRPLPDHLPGERIVCPAPVACPCCGGTLRKLGEDVTDTLEIVPRQWKVIQHVREKFSCRACEAITQPPAPSDPNAPDRRCLRRSCSPNMPCTCRSIGSAKPTRARGADLDVSTLADWVTDEKHRHEAAEIIRSPVEKIVLKAAPEGSDAAMTVDLHGDLAGILCLSSQTKKPPRKGGDYAESTKLVAGGGFEPPTFRL